MKKILYTLILITIVFYSCDNELSDHKYNSGWFVAFESSTIQGKESASEITIPVLITDEGRKEQVTVNFELTPSEGIIAGTHYTILNETNSLTFEPGVSIQYIRIKPIDDLFPDADKTILLTITSNSKNYIIGMPGPDKLNSSCQLIIKEDDCPLTLDLFSGKVEGLEDSPFWTNCPGKYEWTPIEELAPGKIKYKISGWFYPQLLTSDWAWYTSESELTFYATTVIIDVTNPADPRYTMLEEDAFIDYEDWGMSIKPVDNQPLNIDVCGKYIEIPYTMLGSSWAHNYIFTVKFQFD